MDYAQETVRNTAGMQVEHKNEQSAYQSAPCTLELLQRILAILFNI